MDKPVFREQYSEDPKRDDLTTLVPKQDDPTEQVCSLATPPLPPDMPPSLCTLYGCGSGCQLWGACLLLPRLALHVSAACS